MKFNRKAGALPKVRTNPRKRHTPGEMNKMEAAYAELLDGQLHEGKLVAWWFESWKWRLGTMKAWYTPDFVVLRPNGTLEIHEVKGYMEDAALLRLKTFASFYPMPVFVIRRKKKEWQIEHFTDKEDAGE